MHKKKPDALLILALVFGLGVLVSAISHGSSDEDKALQRDAVTGLVQTPVSQ